MTDFTFTRYWKQLRRVKKPARILHNWWTRQKPSQVHIIEVTAEEWDFINSLPDEPDPVVVERWKLSGSETRR